MSYVEKAFFYFLKLKLTSGFKALFSSKYVLYTLIALGAMIASTLYYVLNLTGTINQLAAPIPRTPLVYYVELGIAFSFVFGGLLFSRTDAIIQIPLLLILAGASTALFWKLEGPVSGYYAILSFSVWITITVVASFTFSRNLFGSKILGSIIFLGKPREERGIIFGGLFYLLFLVDMFIGGYLAYEGYTKTDQVMEILGIIIVFSSLLVIVSTYLGSIEDDVFFTILALYYAVSSFRIISYYLKIQSKTSSEVSFTDVLLAVFFLLYSVSGYGLKIKKSAQKAAEKRQKEEEEEELTEQKVKRKRWFHRSSTLLNSETKQRIDEEIEEQEGLLWIDRIKQKIGDKGGILLMLGIVMGYHVSQLEAFTRGTDVLKEVPLSVVFGRPRVSMEIAILLSSIALLGILMLYWLSPSFRFYASPEIYRFDFLPPFEKLLELMDKIKQGKTSVKKLSTQILLSTAKGSLRGLLSRKKSLKESLIESGIRSIEQIFEETEENNE